jgi:hypothetical protein
MYIGRWTQAGYSSAGYFLLPRDFLDKSTEKVQRKIVVRWNERLKDREASI